MLDMGFREDIKKWWTRSTGRGTEAANLLFSATLPAWVKQTAKKYMVDPQTIDLVQDDNRKASTSVQHLCIKCPWQKKPAAAGACIRVYGGVTGRAILFCETKKECNDLAQDQNLNVVRGGCGVLHGDIQNSGNLRCKPFATARFGFDCDRQPPEA